MTDWPMKQHIRVIMREGLYSDFVLDHFPLLSIPIQIPYGDVPKLIEGLKKACEDIDHRDIYFGSTGIQN